MEQLSLNDFDRVYALLERNFPLAEYRSYDNQKALWQRPEYRVLAMRDPAGQIIAIAAVWDLPDFRFLEHLAVDPAMHNQGLGTKMLAALMDERRIYLEVEPPETPIARRRIGFYQRMGFFLNDYPYRQPSMGDGRPPIPLKIMTAERPISPEEFREVRDLLYQKVYGAT